MKIINHQEFGRICNGWDDHAHVPEELVFEILLKLPVKSLIRFKIVSKNWYNLITSSVFINNHFRNNNCTRILTFHYLHNLKEFDEACFTVFSFESLDRLDLDYLTTPFYYACLLGPVNGLFLIGHRHGYTNIYRLALLNPATRELKILSDLSSSSSSMHGFGFGFDPLTNDFKVVALWDDNGDGWRTGPVNMAVYSLSSDSWKHLSPFNVKIPDELVAPFSGSHAPYLNGACYWLSYDDYSVISFDFGCEVVRVINGPQNTIYLQYDYGELFIYNYDSLGMFLGIYGKNTSGHRKMSSIDLMVMKEEGCWTKHFTIDVSPVQLYLPLCVWKDNKLLLEIVEKYERFGEFNEHTFATTKMVSYDPTTHEIQEPYTQPKDYYCGGSLQVINYNESLISLKGSRNDNKSISDIMQDFFTFQGSSC